MDISKKEFIKNLPVVGLIAKYIFYKFKTMLTRIKIGVGIFSPLLIDVNKNRSEYFSKLTKPAKKNYKLIKKRNKDIFYNIIPFSNSLFIKYYEIWARYFEFEINYLDKIYGLVDKGIIIMFAAELNMEIISIQLVEKYGTYMRCQMPMYDKDIYHDRNLGTFMWFSLIGYAIAQHNINFIDLGGGPLKKLPTYHYKRRYSPEDNKLLIRECYYCYYVYLFEPHFKRGEKSICPNCQRKLKLGIGELFIINISYYI